MILITIMIAVELRSLIACFRGGGIHFSPATIKLFSRRFHHNHRECHQRYLQNLRQDRRDQSQHEILTSLLQKSSFA